MRKWESKDQDKVEESFLTKKFREVVTHDEWHMYHAITTDGALRGAQHRNGRKLDCRLP